MRLPLVWLGIGILFVYSGIAIGVGNWSYSLLSEARGVPATLAGSWGSLFLACLTIGRIIIGVLVQRFAPSTLLRWCMAGAVFSALLIWLNLALWLMFAGTALLGFALAPQLPLLISATPGYVGPQHANNAVGVEVAVGSLGGAVLPSLIGVLARVQGLEAFGPFLFISALGMATLFELLLWRLPRATDGSRGRL